MKTVRLSLSSWRNLLNLALSYAIEVGTPTEAVSYLRDRLLDRPDSGWIGFDNGWSEEDFEAWDQRAIDYVNAVSDASRPAVALAVLKALQKTEMAAVESSSDTGLELFRAYEPSGGGGSSFGLLCAKNDALGSVAHSLACFTRRILAMRVDFEVSGIRELSETSASTAEFHGRNRLAAEYFPYLAVLRQIKKQSPAHLKVVASEFKRLEQAVRGLPFDDAALRRQRQALVKIVEEILKAQ